MDYVHGLCSREARKINGQGRLTRVEKQTKKKIKEESQNVHEKRRTETPMK